MTAPHLRIHAIDIAERPVVFTQPFRFGSMTMTAAPQAYVRVSAEVEGSATVGASAELMVPKWFDKDPAKSPEQTIAELRRSLVLARKAYLGGEDTAFGLHAARIGGQVAVCRREGIPRLAAAFGPAEIDKAVLDALFRACGVGAFEGLARNLGGLDARLTPDLDETAIEAFLAGRAPRSSVPVRHAVGLLDPLDGLPEALRATGSRYLKIKLGGDLAADRARLAAIGTLLEGRVLGASLDANEQYALAALRELADALDGDPSLRPIRERLIYVEQPLPREDTFDEAPGILLPLVVDEADDAYDAFPRARALGYAGVSSKSCKGLWKALLNAVRAQAPGLFMTAEDLTCQPGLALQQDTVLAAFIGVPHAERNGHRYVDGFTDSAEGDLFARGLPFLYRRGDDGRVRLSLENGEIAATVLGTTAGYGSVVHPDALPLF